METVKKIFGFMWRWKKLSATTIVISVILINWSLPTLRSLGGDTVRTDRYELGTILSQPDVYEWHSPIEDNDHIGCAYLISGGNVFSRWLDSQTPVGIQCFYKKEFIREMVILHAKVSRGEIVNE